MGRRLVIDTDIGTDVDDLWTLAMLPGLAGIDLEAVTLVYGDTDVRARLASVALAAMGIDVPVYRGCEQPLSGKAVMWAGHEGVGVPGLADAHYEPGDAVDVLLDLAAAEPGSLEVLAIGPLTNIATAIRRDPAFAHNVRRLWVMGGEFQAGWPEHNFASDAVATEIVLGSGAAITIVPLDQTLRVPVDEHDVDRIAAVHPIGPLMADEARRFWQFLSGLREGMPNDRSWAHDPLTLLALAEPAWFTFSRMAVAVEADGRVRGTLDAVSVVEVATDLDPEGAHTAFLRTLGCPPPLAPKDT
jgi:purine nucleosidase